MKKYISLSLGLLFSINLLAQSYSADTLRPKCIVLRRFMEQKHYQPLRWSDTSSVLLFDHWIHQLDENKLLFTKEDIDALSIYRNTLDKEMNGDSWAFFDLSIRLYKKRLQQTDSIAEAMLAKPFDFSKPDDIQWPFPEYASSVAALAGRWEQLYKWKVLDRIKESEDSSDHFTTKVPASFAAYELKAREALKRQHLARMNEVFQSSVYFEHNMGEAYLNAICWCYDPHSSYMNVAAKKAFETELSPFKYSAGIDVEKNDKGEWVVTKLVPGSPAWRSGDIHKGDVLLKIKSGVHAELTLEDLDADEVLSLLQGVNDDKILVTFKREGSNEQAVLLNKEELNDDESTVASFEINDAAKIGYIELPDFYTEPNENNTAAEDGCANDIAKEIVKLKKDSIRGLILDLRYDGGGSVQEALALAGIFIDAGPLCSTKDRTGKVHFLKDPNRGTIYDGPLIVMVNSQSASASELVSGVLQNYNRALIVGGKTYGKGTGQVILPMDTTGYTYDNVAYPDYVKVTTGKFYRVDGSTAQWKGIIPDIILPDFYDDDAYREKGNASALLPDSSKPAMYELFQSLGTLPIAALQQLSKTRISADTNFIELQKFSALSAQQLKSMDVPLQWPSFFSYTQNDGQLLSDIERRDSSAQLRLHVTKNSFDATREKFESKQTDDVNQAFMDRIGGDDYIRESCNILQDWIKMEN
jgi:carboxyl-terminal processing protease